MSSGTLVGFASDQLENLVVHGNSHFFEIEGGDVERSPEDGVAVWVFFELVELLVNADAVHGVDGDVDGLVLVLDIVGVI